MPREDFAKLAPPPLPVSPDWSPVKHYGGYNRPAAAKRRMRRAIRPEQKNARLHDYVGAMVAKSHRSSIGVSGLWSMGCDCSGP